jgi:DNA polymerase-4
MSQARSILHVDMDAFYASVEIREQPGLAGRPVIVGGAPERRGVVSAASYEARRFGVHSAMPTARALRLCPGAVFLPVRMERYAAVSRQIRDIFARYTPLVEPLSLDEAFLDVTGSQTLFGSARDIARAIKQAIADELQLVASVGVAPNKFLAKIASDLDKPDGFVEVAHGAVQDFLDPLPASRVWGVGKATCAELERYGIRTIADLRRQPRDWLVDRFGRFGERLFELARGIDSRPVVPDSEAKSISHETTFPTDVTDRRILHARLLDLTEQVARRLRRHQRLARTVQLKLRFADFRSITRSRTLPGPSDLTAELWQTVEELFTTALQKERRAVRLIGMGVQDLVEPAARPHIQGDLFAEPQRGRQREIDRLADAIQSRFGPAGIRRGRSLRDRDEGRGARDEDELRAGAAPSPRTGRDE